MPPTLMWALIALHPTWSRRPASTCTPHRSDQSWTSLSVGTASARDHGPLCGGLGGGYWAAQAMEGQTHGRSNVDLLACRRVR